ncbi:uncharacterized protein [Typha latifolia]|uniref:uncharacterized protein n=1 Tax=Typha latifolia TaxID=4733 RepID=UPI003C30AD4C
MLTPLTAIHFPPQTPSLSLPPLLTLRRHFRSPSPFPILPLKPPIPVYLSAAADHHTSPAPPPQQEVSAEVDMVRGRDGVWSARSPSVVVLWDLDNKPPRGPPYAAASSLFRAASLLGRVVEISAYANRHAFSHLPGWVLDQRRERRQLDLLERRGLAAPSEPYVCSVCGRRCSTRPDLKRHFLQLHERERQKKLSRMRSLKGKKRQRYRERFISNNHKYEEAARELLTPKAGYGLASELRRAGVFVRTVEDKPQAADAALKRQIRHSMARGVDWMVLVSDDSDFVEMMRRAREAELRTVVVGDGLRALGKVADIWLPWDRVESGAVGEETIQDGWRRKEYKEMEEEEGFTKVSEFYDDGDTRDLDDVVDQILARNSGSLDRRISMFSEEEVVNEGTDREDLEEDGFDRSSKPGEEDLLWDSEDEEDDVYI